MSVERSELVEVIRAAMKAADAAKLKGVLVTSQEASRCVEALNRIKNLPLTAETISTSNTVRSLHSLAKHGNPKIRSEARTVLYHWRRTLDVTQRDNGKKADPNSRVKEERERSETDNKKSVAKSKLLELFDAAQEAADAVRGSVSLSSPEATRCVEILDLIKSLLTHSLTVDLTCTTYTGRRLEALTKHKNPKIGSAAKSLLNEWLRILYWRGRPDNTDKKRESNSFKKASRMTGKAKKSRFGEISSKGSKTQNQCMSD